MKLIQRFILAALTLFGLAASANATPWVGTTTISEYCSLGICYPTAGGFNLAIAGTPTTASGPGTLTVQWYGESDDNGGEWLDISLEGNSFGRLSDGNPANDPFNGVGAGGADRWSMNYGGLDPYILVSTTISQSLLNSLLADGQIDINGIFGYDVDNYGTGEYVKFTIAFERIDANEVPAPGTFALFALGAAALAASRRKRRML